MKTFKVCVCVWYVCVYELYVYFCVFICVVLSQESHSICTNGQHIRKEAEHHEGSLVKLQTQTYTITSTQTHTRMGVVKVDAHRNTHTQLRPHTLTLLATGSHFHCRAQSFKLIVVQRFATCHNLP